jgi:hypothetical protein
VNAPLQVVVVPVPVAPGDRGVWKKAQHRHHKAVRPADPPWPPKQPIPHQNRDALRRRAQQWREAVRPQARAMIIEARMRLAA